MTATVGIDYFAVLDPQDPGLTTFWKLTGRGLISWPPSAKYGPKPSKGSTTVGLVARLAWQSRILAAIGEAPYVAAARFAVLRTRCVCCGRTLREPESRTLGIGPECRREVSHEVLARLSESVGRLHAASTSTWAEPLPFPVGEAA